MTLILPTGNGSVQTCNKVSQWFHEFVRISLVDFATRHWAWITWQWRGTGG